MKRILFGIISATLIMVGLTKICAKTNGVWQKYNGETFSISYPSSWEKEIENYSTSIGEVNINLIIMQKSSSPYDFRPNINIITGQKRSESTYELALISKRQNSTFATVYPPVSVIVCGLPAHRIDYTFSYQGFSMFGRQYIVKKIDNSVYIITLTVDKNKMQTQLPVAESIFKTFRIK